MLHLRIVPKQSLLPKRVGYRPDFRLGDTIVELKSDLHSFRNLRAALLQLAYYINEETAERGLLVLVHPRISDEALHKEWWLLERTLQPKVLRRMSLAVRRESGVTPIAGDLPKGLDRELLARVDHEARIQPHRAPQTSDAILLVLLNEWLLRKGPMTTHWLMQAVGCSYPTVANALRRLGAVIKRFPDRRFQLWGFPTEEWQRVVANRERSHPTLHYLDRSGQRRGAEVLLHRAVALDRSDLGVGGVFAARHYHPDFDLRGTPRLDLTLHSPNGRVALSFVEQLDPALERTSANDEHADLAIHILRRREHFFVSEGGGLPFVDRVSTLLDLYDARLTSQAREFQDYLVESVG
jgi:hypothetical protein